MADKETPRPNWGRDVLRDLGVDDKYAERAYPTPLSERAATDTAAQDKTNSKSKPKK